MEREVTDKKGARRASKEKRGIKKGRRWIINVIKNRKGVRKR